MGARDKRNLRVAEQPELQREVLSQKQTDKQTNKQETKATINTKAKCLKCVSTALGTYDKSNKG